MSTAETQPQAVTEDTVTMHVVPEAVQEAAAEKRPFPDFPVGDALISSLPGFDIPPCGHCGTAFADAPPDVLTRTRVLGVLRHHAYEAGWDYDRYGKWTCPGCRLADAERAARWDSLQTQPGVTLEDIFHEHEITVRSIMTASGRYAWDYDDWRYTWRPRPEYCVPEPEPAAEGQAA